MSAYDKRKQKKLRNKYVFIPSLGNKLCIYIFPQKDERYTQKKKKEKKQKRKKKRNEI